MHNGQLATSWRYTGAWDGIAIPGHLGRATEDPIRLAPFGRFGAALIAPRVDECAEVSRILEAQLGLGLPPPRCFLSAGSRTIAWAGPSKWLAISTEFELAKVLSNTLSGIAAVSDQSGARAILSLSGRRARELMAKGLAIDLHPTRFKPGDTALVSIAHMNVQLWQTDEVPSYTISGSRSMAESLWSWLVHSGAEFGLSVDAF